MLAGIQDDCIGRFLLLGGRNGKEWWQHALIKDGRKHNHAVGDQVGRGEGIVAAPTQSARCAAGSGSPARSRSLRRSKPAMLSRQRVHQLHFSILFCLDIKA